ncbi:hypothetical protein VPH35_001953 [Triticum aestivum]
MSHPSNPPPLPLSFSHLGFPFAPTRHHLSIPTFSSIPAPPYQITAYHRPRPPPTSHLELLQDHHTAESQHSTRSTSAAAHLTPAPWSSKFVGSPLLRSGRERVPSDLP